MTDDPPKVFSNLRNFPAAGGSNTGRTNGALRMKQTAKLDDHEVIALRQRKAAGEKIDVKVEADRFACSPETIRKILRGDTFRHLVANATPLPEDAAAAFEKFAAQVKAAEGLEKPDEDIRALLRSNPGVIQ